MTQAIDWSSIPWQQLRDGVERKACSGDNVSIAMHRVSAAARTELHVHPEEQIVYVLSGALEYRVGERVHVLAPGHVLVVPSGIPHHSRTVSAEPAVTLDVFAPGRKYP